MQSNVIFAGGPLHGKRRQVDAKGQYFNVPVWLGLRVEFRQPDEYLDGRHIQFCRYRIEKFVTPNIDWRIGIEESLSTDQAFLMILDQFCAAN